MSLEDKERQKLDDLKEEEKREAEVFYTILFLKQKEVYQALKNLSVEHKGVQPTIKEVDSESEESDSDDNENKKIEKEEEENNEDDGNKTHKVFNVYFYF